MGGKIGIAICFTFFGHLKPILRILKELVDRGDTVYCISDAESAPLVESVGAIAIAEFNFDKSDNTMFKDWKIFEFIYRQGNKIINSLDRFIERIQPNYIIYDSLLVFVKILCEKHSVKSVIIHPTSLANEDLEYVPNPEKYLIFKNQNLEEVYNNIISEILFMYSTLRMPNHIKSTHMFKGDLLLVAAATIFEQDQGGKRVLIFPGIEKDALDTSERSCIYISFGTLFAKNQHIINIIIDLCKIFGEEKFIISTGGLDLKIAGELPSNIQVHSFLNQEEVLKIAKIFVTHGGMGSLTEAIMYGVPALIIPSIPEQHYNGLRLIELGGGELILNEDVNLDNMSDRISKMLKCSAYRKRMNEIQKIVAKQKNYSDAAKIIDSLKISTS